jgi:ABC-2 type transport system permease protein
VNVPAQILVRPIQPQSAADWSLPGFAILATIASFAGSRWVFQRALWSYRSASS